MTNLLKYVVTLIFVALVLFICLSNSNTVTFSIYPLMSDINLSVAIIFALGILLGFVWGALIVWLNGAKMRNNFRALRNNMQNLQKNRQ